VKTNVAVSIFILLVLLIGLQLLILYDLDKYPVNLSVSVENGMVLEFEATGYAIGPPYSTTTKNGQPVLNEGFMNIGGMNIFTIAVDPRVISLGSVVFIEGIGLGFATDTGPEIKGMDIDICFQNMDKAVEFGRQKVKVIILKGSLNE